MSVSLPLSLFLAGRPSPACIFFCIFCSCHHVTSSQNLCLQAVFDVSVPRQPFFTLVAARCWQQMLQLDRCFIGTAFCFFIFGSI